MLFALAAMVELFVMKIDAPFVEMTCQILICGGAFYYVLHTYKKRRAITLLMVLMTAVGLLYNPVVPISMSEVLWLLAHIVTMILFYSISLKTPIDDSIITHKEDE